MTAPTTQSRRSVRFADELGLDVVGKDARPTSAPERKKSPASKKGGSMLGVDLDSSLDESNKEWFSKSRRKNSRNTTESVEVQKKGLFSY